MKKPLDFTRLSRARAAKAWAEESVDLEIRHHIEMRTDELIEEGLTPEEARRMAEEAFGQMERYRTECVALQRREVRKMTWMDRLVGLAFEVRVTGYQDALRLLYGYSPEAEAIIGLRVLESRETPGLGDRIETDTRFLANFERLDVSLSDDLSRVARPIEAVKRGAKQEAWQVEGISGATISSAAVARGLRESTVHWIPRIHGHLDDFRERR